MFVNSRLDVALALGAHLHLASNALTVSDVKPWLRPGMLVSHAVHSAGEFQPGADLALVSPVFAPRSKTVESTLGPAGFGGGARSITSVDGRTSPAVGGILTQVEIDRIVSVVI